MPTSPTNLDLATEAKSTTDPIRQAELLQHPSDLVLNALSKNPNLTPEIAQSVTNKIQTLRNTVSDAANLATKV